MAVKKAAKASKKTVSRPIQPMLKVVSKVQPRSSGRKNSASKKETVSKEAEKVNGYTAKDIYVIEGLEPVRKRPGMYIGSTGPSGLHHLIWEVFDNSRDEAMGGFATNVEIKLLKDNVVSVRDNGRGIPVDVHKQTKKSALETVMTTLHAGGKFGGESYKVSGGLHGVGVSVVNALSKYLIAEVCRDGERLQQEYLTAGVKIQIKDEREKEEHSHRSYAFCFESGIRSYVKYLNRAQKPKHEDIFYVSKEQAGIKVEVAPQYIDNLASRELAFANNIYNPDGGTHLTGFRSALTRVLNDYARKNGYLKEKDSLT